MEKCINEKEFLSLKETAKLLGISNQTASRLTNVNGFPCIKLQRRILINKNKLFQWLEQNKNIVY